jgi:hypothetical protein
MIKCDEIWVDDGRIMARSGLDYYVYVGDKGHQQTNLESEHFITSLHGCIGYHGWRRLEDI